MTIVLPEWIGYLLYIWTGLVTANVVAKMYLCYLDAKRVAILKDIENLQTQMKEILDGAN